MGEEKSPVVSQSVTGEWMHFPYAKGNNDKGKKRGPCAEEKEKTT